jgi:RNA polymerase sigma-70 factor (ECF subfamily)
MLFDRLYRAYFDDVLRVLVRYGVPARDAPDVAHDVFLDVSRKIADYDPSRPAKPWIHAFAVRHARNYLALARWSREELFSEIPAAPTMCEQARSPEELLLAREEWEHFTENLARIKNPQLITIFRMHYFDGLTMPEITRRLGIPLNTGYTRLRRARDTLRRYGVLLRDVA